MHCVDSLSLWWRRNAASDRASTRSRAVARRRLSVPAAEHVDVVGGGSDGETLDLSRRRHEPIPLVDLTLPPARLVPQLHAACEYPGFFFLTGLPRSTLDAKDGAFAAARRFYDQPLASKMELTNRPELQYRVRDANGRSVPVPATGNGYRSVGGDAHFANDSRESFNVGREPLAPGEDPPYANAWPGEATLPGFRSAVLAHQDEQVALAVRLRGLIALALGVDAGFFDRPGLFDRPTYQTGMVRYNEQRSDPTAGLLSIRPHADGGIFTLLYTDGEPGLHICPEKHVAPHARQWIAVEPRADAAIVNLGTELERWSNGRFRATLHAVVNESGRGRISLPFFYETNIDATIEPLCHDGEPARFPPSSPAANLLAGLCASRRIV